MVSISETILQRCRVGLVIQKHLKLDIFCKVVDNFGDIGVCWRLARQLHQTHGLPVRLFVDNLADAAKIVTGLTNVAEQQCEGVEIIHWDDHTAFASTANIVVETFACGLPPAYLAKMNSEVVWVNVDHLSAESWVAEFHGLNGKHHETNLTRHFYFPGFESDTGGLLREQDLIVRRDAFQVSAPLQQAFWQSLMVLNQASDLSISLFYYENAPVDDFLQSLADGDRSVLVYMPFNSNVPTTLLGHTGLAVGDCLSVGALTLHILPFLQQDDYDKLLWACDINFVRGEDSWVRAVFAGKPFIWQPYWQEDNAHLLKLNAFLSRFYQQAELHPTLVKLHEAWSTETFCQDSWQHYLLKLPDIASHTQQQSQGVIQQEDLVSKLLAFVRI